MNNEQFDKQKAYKLFDRVDLHLQLVLKNEISLELFELRL